MEGHLRTDPALHPLPLLPLRRPVVVLIDKPETHTLGENHTMSKRIGILRVGAEESA